MSHFKTIFKVILIQGFILQQASAAINRAAIVLAKPSLYFGARGELISADLIEAYNQVKGQQKPFDVSKVIPADLQPTADSNQVFAKIADQSVSSFFNSAEMRATPLGKTATTVEQKMKQDITVREGQIEHKLTFQVQAFQSVAKIDYHGYTNATLKYQASDSSVGLEIYEKISGAKDIVLAQVQKPSDRISSMSVRWNF